MTLLKKYREDITDEALTIQNWNVDDIKFTEIETVDIIKAKPLKENWKILMRESKEKLSKTSKENCQTNSKNKPKIIGDVKMKKSSSL